MVGTDVLVGLVPVRGHQFEHLLADPAVFSFDRGASGTVEGRRGVMERLRQGIVNLALPAIKPFIGQGLGKIVILENESEERPYTRDGIESISPTECTEEAPFSVLVGEVEELAEEGLVGVGGEKKVGEGILEVRICSTLGDDHVGLKVGEGVRNHAIEYLQIAFRLSVRGQRDVKRVSLSSPLPEFLDVSGPRKEGVSRLVKANCEDARILVV